MFIRTLKEKGYIEKAHLLEDLLKRYKVINIDRNAIMASNDIVWFLRKKQEEESLNVRQDVKPKDINCFDLFSLWCILKWFLNEDNIKEIHFFTSDLKDFINKGLYKILTNLQIENLWYIAYKSIVYLDKNQNISYEKISVANLFLMKFQWVNDKLFEKGRDIWFSWIPF